ncbi:MAG: manganese efflux pump MntP family protein [Polyangiaceae bacterium]
MTFLSIIAIALGVSMDAFAVAAARGLSTPSFRVSDAARVGAFFGGFQAGMPLIGYFAGAFVGRWIEAWDHWIAFGLLLVLGARMVKEGVTNPPEESPAGSAKSDADPPVSEGRRWPEQASPFSSRALFVLAVATSIDALAVGVTLPIMHAPLALTVTTIGLTTGLLSFAGVYVGRRFGSMLGARLTGLGGLILIGLGVKILIEHLSG